MEKKTRSASYSRRDTYRRCPRKYYFQYELGLEPKGVQESAPLRMGSVYAACLEHWSTEPVREAYKGYCYSASNAYERSLLLCESTIIESLVENYLQLHRPPQQAEVAWELQPLTKLGTGTDKSILWSFNGRFDGVDASSKQVLIIENKLKKSFTDRDELRLKVDDQCTTYIAAASEKYGVDIPKIKVRYDVALKPGIKRTKKETHKEFIERLKNYINDPGRSLHKSFILDRTVDQIERWVADNERLTQKMDDDHRDNHFLPNYHECISFGEVCPFFKICSEKDQKNVPEIIKTRYNIKQ
jgi:hypothetical protein